MELDHQPRMHHAVKLDRESWNPFERIFFICDDYVRRVVRVGVTMACASHKDGPESKRVHPKPL